MRYLSYLSASVVTLSIVSCGDQPDSDIAGPDTRPTATYLFDYNDKLGEIPGVWDRWYPIDSGVNFTISEEFSPYGEISDPMLVVHQATDEIYNANNFSIINAVNTSPGVIRVAIESAYIGNLEIDSAGPAHTHSYFSAPDGEYTLEFAKDGIVDSYKLAIDSKSFAIDPIRTSFTRNKNEVAGRYVERTFGLYWTGDSARIDDFNALVDALLEDENIVEITTDDQPLNLLRNLRPIGGKNAPRLFQYANTSYFPALRTSISRFISEHYPLPQDYRFVAVSWRNERFDSNWFR